MNTDAYLENKQVPTEVALLLQAALLLIGGDAMRKCLFAPFTVPF